MSSLCMSLCFPLLQLNYSRYLLISTGEMVMDTYIKLQQKYAHQPKAALIVLMRTECCVNGFEDC